MGLILRCNDFMNAKYRNIIVRISFVAICSIFLLGPESYSSERKVTKNQTRSPSDDISFSCMGPEGSKINLVYLHGMDSATPSQQEQTNRGVLAKIANELNIRIALPRASKPCPTQPNSVCWGWSFNQSEIDSTKGTIEAAAQNCFGTKAHYGMLGFSNGGYLLSQAYRSCTLQTNFPDGGWLAIVGAARYSGNLPVQPASLKGCGSLTILSGSEDQYNSDLNQNYLHVLAAKGADATEIPYSGGHLLPYPELKTALEKLFAPLK